MGRATIKAETLRLPQQCSLEVLSEDLVCTRAGRLRRSVRRSWLGHGGPSGGACLAMWDSGQVGFRCSKGPDCHLTVP